MITQRRSHWQSLVHRLSVVRIAMSLIRIKKFRKVAYIRERDNQLQLYHRIKTNDNTLYVKCNTTVLILLKPQLIMCQLNAEVTTVAVTK